MSMAECSKLGFVALAAAGRWSVLGNFGFGPDWALHLSG